MEPQPKSYTKLGFLVLFFIIIVVISAKFFQGPFEMITSFKFDFRSKKLSNVINQSLKDKPGEFAVYVQDLTDTENASVRSLDTFPAASLYKLFLLGAVMKEIENTSSVIPAQAGIQNSEETGSRVNALESPPDSLQPGMTMDTVVTASKQHLINVFGDTDFGYEEAPETIEYTVEEALERVGRISDNFASIMLAEKIGWDKVQSFADSLGAVHTSIKNPISTSASDIANFFKKLYTKQIVSESASQKIVEILQLSKINDRLPAKLPDGVNIIHKTGELGRVRHDAGIVYTAKGAYVIVVMSQNLPYEDEGVEVIANLSKDVYNYMNSK